MLATLTDKPFDDPEWMFEIKWDGYRSVAILDGNKVSLLSRNEKSFDEKFYPIHDALIKWNLHAVLDGEIVVIMKTGRPISEHCKTGEANQMENSFFTF